MKKEGIIEFKSFEEIKNSYRQDTEKKQQLLKKRIKEILEGYPSNIKRYENVKREKTSEVNDYININISDNSGKEKEKEILNEIHEHGKEIHEINCMISNHKIGVENMIYSFYDSSFKVYELQSVTERMVDLFCVIGKCHFQDLNPLYVEIISEGTNKKFDWSHKIRWSYETRPILEAFFHSHHLLQMMEKYGLDRNSGNLALDLNEGWANVLNLYKTQ